MASEAEVDLLINAAGALPELERDLGRIIATAQRNADDIDVHAAVDTRDSLDAITADLRTVLRAAENGAPDIDVIAVLDELDSLNRLRSSLDNVISSVDNNAPNINVNALLDNTRSLRSVRRDLDSLVRTAQRSIDDIDVNVRVDVDEDQTTTLRRFGDLVGNVGQSAARAIGPIAGVAGGVGAMGVAAGGAVPLVAGLAAAVETIAPASAVAVSGMLTLQLAAGTTKLAMVGVQEAIETAFDPEATPEELAEAMERLAPEARKFVTELRSMRDELRTIQQRVQNNFFRGFDTALKDLSRSVAPAATSALDATSKSLNRMALGAADAATKLADDGILGKALDSSVASLKELESVPGQAVTSLGLLAAAAGPSMERVARAVSEKVDEIAADLLRAFETGELENSIDEAIDAIAQFGRSVKNIFAGLGHVFGGLTQGGRDLFDILEELTLAFERVTGSREFQIILGELVDTADALVKNVLPLLEKAFEELAPVIKELGPPVRDFINEVGPELTPIIEKLGPILLDLAEIFREQLPFAIEFVKAALEVLGIALDVLHFLLEEIIVPAVELVASVLNNQYVDAISNASRETGNKAISMVQRFEEFRSGVSSAIDHAGVFLRGFVRTVSTWVSDVAEGTRHVISTFTRLPGEITSALGNMASLLFSAGQDVILGFISGMESLLGRVRNIASEIASIASGAVTDLLGISSPSRVMRGFGQNTVEGFVLGLQDQFPDLRREMRDIAASVPQIMADNTGAAPRIQVAPQVGVQVRIGNEVVDRFVTVRVQQENKRRDRVLAQGVRV